jgi:gliding motility-associated-like protein
LTRSLFLIISLCSIFLSLQSKAQLSNAGLALYLPFNGNANDASGNNYHGTVTGATLTNDAFGNPNSAYHFNGNSKIIINNPALLRGSFPEMTILVKVRADSLPMQGGTSIPFYHVFDWYRYVPSGTPPFNQKPQFFMGCSRGDINATVNPGGKAGAFSYYFMNCGNTLASDAGYLKDSTRIIDKWFTIAYVFDHGNVSMVFNCQRFDLWTSVLPTFGPCAADAPLPMELSLGFISPPDLYADNNRNFTGDIDELRVYTRILGDNEINEYATTLCIPEIAPYIEVDRPSCAGPVYRITDRSNTGGIPVTSRKWVINPGNIVVNDVASFQHTFTQTGVYHVTLLLQDSAGYRYSEETVIPVQSLAPGTNFMRTAQKDFFLCNRQSSVQLRVTGAKSYLWEPCIGLSACDSSVVEANPLNTQTYMVRGLNEEGCPDSLSITIRKSKDSAALFVPTAFTPNNDGQNDGFGVQSLAPTGPLVFEVFNRWGQPVFKTSKANNNWDGNYKGAPQPAGVYTWKLKYESGDGCAGNVQKGTVLLVR